jgi:regulatory protein
MTLEREIIENVGLARGAELSEEEMTALERGIVEEKAKLFLLRSLSAREQTRAELEGKLEKREVPKEIAARALEAVVGWGLINDEQVARGLANNLFEKGYWWRRAQVKMRQRGVPGDLAEQIVAEVFLAEEEVPVARRALRGRRANGDLRERKRLLDFLLRRGFSYDAAKKALSEDEA